MLFVNSRSPASKLARVSSQPQPVPWDAVAAVAVGGVLGAEARYVDAATVDAELGVDVDERGRIVRDDAYRSTVPGVYVAGDNGRGQSLIVWAIAEGRACANGVDTYLSGTSALPRPIGPDVRQLMV